MSRSKRRVVPARVVAADIGPEPDEYVGPAEYGGGDPGPAVVETVVPRRPSWDEVRRADRAALVFRDLDAVAVAESLVRAAEVERLAAVRRARSDGVSWAAIGARLGVTGEGARRKFSAGSVRG